MKFINERTVQIARNIKQMGLGSFVVQGGQAVHVFEGPVVPITSEMAQEAGEVHEKIISETNCLVFLSDCLVAVAVQHNTRVNR